MSLEEETEVSVGGGQVNHLAAPRKAGLQDRSTTPPDSVVLAHYPRGGWDVTKRTFTALGAVAGVSGLKHRALGYLPEDSPGPAVPAA
jgi:hypothetical protein